MISMIPANSSIEGAGPSNSDFIFSISIIVVCLDAAFRTKTEVSFNSETSDLMSINFLVLFL